MIYTIYKCTENFKFTKTQYITSAELDLSWSREVYQSI